MIDDAATQTLSRASVGLARAELQQTLEVDRRGSAVADVVDLGQYVDQVGTARARQKNRQAADYCVRHHSQTLLSVSPKIPLEIVMQMFRRMGPRVILVAQEGKLVGLVTVKDVLRHEAAAEHKQTLSQLPTPITAESAAGANQSWHQRLITDDDAAGLEVVLEEAYTRLQALGGDVSTLLDRLKERFGTARSGRSRTRMQAERDRFAGEGYELQGDDR